MRVLGAAPCDAPPVMVLRWILGAVVVLHGLLHLLGFVKAFGIAELSALQQPISRPLGVVWLLAAVVLIAAGVAAVFSPRTFWMLAVAGAVISQLVIVTSWTDARWGSLGNVIVLVAAVLSFLEWGPAGVFAEYTRRTGAVLAAASVPPEAVPLSALPAPLARYLEVTGAAGRPVPRSFRARLRGRIRSAADGGWMQLESEQVSTLTPMARLFYMDATKLGVPAYGLHAYVGEAATMDVRLLGALRVVDARGPEMTRAETVTLLNDAALLCPAWLATPAFRWEAIDERRVRGSLTNAGHTVSAELVFGEDGMLVDFVSDDRSRSVDGKSFERLRWSTPVRGPRAFGALRLAALGEARWHPATGSFAYLEVDIVDVEMDPSAPTLPRQPPQILT